MNLRWKTAVIQHKSLTLLVGEARGDFILQALPASLKTRPLSFLNASSWSIFPLWRPTRCGQLNGVNTNITGNYGEMFKERPCRVCYFYRYVSRLRERERERWGSADRLITEERTLVPVGWLWWWRLDPVLTAGWRSPVLVDLTLAVELGPGSDCRLDGPEWGGGGLSSCMNHHYTFRQSPLLLTTHKDKEWVCIMVVRDGTLSLCYSFM